MIVGRDLDAMYLLCSVTVKTQIEDTGARTLEFPFSATRGGNTAKLSPKWRQNERNIPGALLGEATPTS